MGSDEVIQAYISQKQGLKNQPLYSLKSFMRIHLNAGETKTVSFSIDAHDLQLVDEKGESKELNGDYELIVGNASPGKRSVELGASFSQKTFTIK